MVVTTISSNPDRFIHVTMVAISLFHRMFHVVVVGIGVDHCADPNVIVGRTRIILMVVLVSSRIASLQLTNVAVVSFVHVIIITIRGVGNSGGMVPSH